MEQNVNIPNVVATKSSSKMARVENVPNLLDQLATDSNAVQTRVRLGKNFCQTALARKLPYHVQPDNSEQKMAAAKTVSRI